MHHNRLTGNATDEEVHNKIASKCPRQKWWQKQEDEKIKKQCMFESWFSLVHSSDCELFMEVDDKTSSP